MTDVKPGRLRNINPDRTRNILQIVKGTTGGWSTVNVDGSRLWVLQKSVAVYRGPPVFSGDQLLVTQPYVRTFWRGSDGPFTGCERNVLGYVPRCLGTLDPDSNIEAQLSDVAVNVKFSSEPPLRSMSDVDVDGTRRRIKIGRRPKRIL